MAFVQNPVMVVTRAAVHGAVRGRLAPPARVAITGGIAFRSASVHTDFPASNCRIDSEIVPRIYGCSAWASGAGVVGGAKGD